MGTTIINGKEIDKFIFNLAGIEKDLAQVYMNTKLIFQKSVSLALPQGVTELNLRAFIDANNPDNHDSIIVTNAFIQPRIVTGELAGLEVTFINNGEIQGLSTNRDAFEATSQVTLINNGYIRGGGGNGGAGGAGLGTSTTVAQTEVLYGSRDYNSCGPRMCYNTTFLNYKGSLHYFTGLTTSGPWTISGVSGTFYKDAYVYMHGGANSVCDSNPNGGEAIHKIRRVYNVTTTLGGGAGGAGGAGMSFDVAATDGAQGLASVPAGGNSGGAGGAGGNWGVAGSTGATGAGPGNVGVVGGNPGAAIRGNEFLSPASVTGTVDGLIVGSGAPA